MPPPPQPSYHIIINSQNTRLHRDFSRPPAERRTWHPIGKPPPLAAVKDKKKVGVPAAPHTRRRCPPPLAELKKNWGICGPNSHSCQNSHLYWNQFNNDCMRFFHNDKIYSQIYISFISESFKSIYRLFRYSFNCSLQFWSSGPHQFSARINFFLLKNW